MMKAAIPIALACVVGAAALARADAGDSEAASTDVVVSGGGGQYQVTLHPSLITSLFLPEKVERVLASNQRDFTIRQMGNAVAVRPLRPDTDIGGNVVITTDSMRVTVLLKVTDDAAEADAQVNFKKAEVEEAIQRRIDAAVERRLDAERARIEKRIELGIGERIFQRFESRRLRAIERNADNVILMVPRVVRVGPDAYLFFRIQNRSGDTYRLTDVTVRAGDADASGPVVFDGQAARGPMLGQVPGGQSADALVIVRDVAGLDERAVTLAVSESGGQRAVSVGGVRIR